MLRPGRVLNVVLELSFKKVPIFFAATAGMRLLELREKARFDHIWDLVRQVVENSEFKQTSIMNTITGFEEAKWAWVAANYLQDSSFNGTKYGTIDYGSSSLQIAFEQNFKTKKSDDQQILNLNGHNVSLYAHSYLCFGNDEIQRRFLAKLVKTAKYSRVLDNPCFFKGFNKTYESDYLWSAPCSSGNYSRDVLGEELTGPQNKTFTITGSGNFPACYNLLDKMINENHNCSYDGLCGLLGTYQPKVHGNFYALSTYYHIAKFLPYPTGKDDYKNKSNDYCSKSYAEVSNTTMDLKYVFPRCFQATYSYFLLENGFKFNDSNWNVDYIKRIGSTKVGWPLGLIYSNKDSMYKVTTRSITKLIVEGYLAMVIVGAFCLFAALMLFVVICRKSKDGKVSV